MKRQKKSHSITVKSLGLSLLVASSVPALANSDEKDTSAEKKVPKIYISADPLSPELSDYSKPATVLTEEDLLLKNQSTLGETLAQEPGVRSSFFGQGASRPVIRGFGAERVRILRNGISTGDMSDVSEDHVVMADPLQATQIEILRGPETLLYGSGAIGGAVNVKDDAIPDEPIGKELTGNLISQFGNSADNEKAFSTRLKGQSGGFNWLFSGFSRRTDDYEIPGLAESDRQLEAEGEEAEEHGEETGIVSNSDTESYGATAGGSYVWDKGYVGVSIGVNNFDYGVPGHIHGHHDHGHGHDHDGLFGEDELHDDHDDHLDMEHHDEEHHDEEHHDEEHHDEEHHDEEHHDEEHHDEEHHDEEHHDEEHHDEEHHDEEHHDEEEEEDVRIEADQVRIDLRGEVNQISENVKAVRYKVGWIDYEHEEIEGGGTSTRYERDTIEGRVEVLHSLTPNLGGAAGLQVLHDDFSALGAEAFLTPTETFNTALFAFEKATLAQNLDLNFGLRAGFVDINPEANRARSFVPFSASIGPVWDLFNNRQYSLSSTLSFSQRAPNAVELYSDGQHLARRIFEIGDADLQKETSWAIDVTAKKNSGIVTGSLTPFYRHFTHYINLVGTGEERNDLPVFRYQDEEAYFWGFEFQSKIHLDKLVPLNGHHLDLENQVDYVRARSISTNSDVPRIPPLRTIVRLRYSTSDNFQTAVEGVFVDSQKETAPLELPTDSYTLLNAEINQRLDFEKVKPNLFVRATNLTNEEARVHSSFLKDLAPLRGRSLLMGIKFDF